MDKDLVVPIIKVEFQKSFLQGDILRFRLYVVMAKHH